MAANRTRPLTNVRRDGGAASPISTQRQDATKFGCCLALALGSVIMRKRAGDDADDYGKRTTNGGFRFEATSSATEADVAHVARVKPSWPRCPLTIHRGATECANRYGTRRGSQLHRECCSRPVRM